LLLRLSNKQAQSALVPYITQKMVRRPVACRAAPTNAPGAGGVWSLGDSKRTERVSLVHCQENHRACESGRAQQRASSLAAKYTALNRPPQFARPQTFLIALYEWPWRGILFRFGTLFLSLVGHERPCQSGRGSPPASWHPSRKAAICALPGDFSKHGKRLLRRCAARSRPPT